MSAAAVWTLLGLYPLAGTDYYVLGSPTFPNVTLGRGPWKGRPLTILANNATHPSNIFVAAVTLNGKALPSPFVRHADLLTPPALLIFTMTDTPSAWDYTPPL